jgi:hypothetical protein
MLRKAIVCIVLAACSGPRASAISIWSKEEETCKEDIPLMSPFGCDNMYQTDDICRAACYDKALNKEGQEYDAQRKNITRFCYGRCNVVLKRKHKGRVVSSEDREACAKECYTEQTGDQDGEEGASLAGFMRTLRGFATMSHEKLNEKSVNIIKYATSSAMLAGASACGYHHTAGRTKDMFMGLTFVFLVTALLLFLFNVGMAVRDALV